MTHGEVMTGAAVIKRQNEAIDKFNRDPKNRLRVLFWAAAQGDKGAEDALLDLAVVGQEQLQRQIPQARESDEYATPRTAR
jgi:hypothetical protein